MIGHANELPSTEFDSNKEDDEANDRVPPMFGATRVIKPRWVNICRKCAAKSCESGWFFAIVFIVPALPSFSKKYKYKI